MKKSKKPNLESTELDLWPTLGILSVLLLYELFKSGRIIPFLPSKLSTVVEMGILLYNSVRKQ